MNISRRELLRLIAAATPVAALPPGTLRLPPPPSRRDRPKDGVLNYGLIFDEADVVRMRTVFRSEERFSDVRDDLTATDFESEHRVLDEDVRYNDQLGRIIPLSLLMERMAFLYLMTGDEAARDLAVKAIRTLMMFQRWDIYMDGDDSIGVQRAPEATIAAVTAIDWLGDAVTADERTKWMRTIGERGCEACYRALQDMRWPQQAEGWHFDPESSFHVVRPGDQHDLNRRAEIISDTNLRALPTAAITIGTIAYELEFERSADSERWLEMGVHSTGTFRNFFGADGSWNEEVHYANYTALNLAKAVIALDRAGMPDLLDVVPWENYAGFLMNMSLPTSDDPYAVVNFGDSGNRKGSPHTFTRAALPLWIARKTRNPTIQWFANTLAGKHTHWSVAWFDPTIDPRPPEDTPALWVSSFDRVVARNGWGPEAMVVAMRSGPPANHEHADRNGIIIKTHGQKLIADPLRPPYGYADAAWPMRLTQGHSAVLVDGRGHEHHNGVEGTNASRSYARVTTNRATDTYALWTSVATQAYRLVDLKIKDVVRTVVVLFSERVVVVADRMSKYEGPSTLTARFFGDNMDGLCKQAVTATGFTCSRPGAVLSAVVEADAPFTVVEGTPFVPTETAQKHPFLDVVTGAAENVLVVTAMALGEEMGSLTAVTIEAAQGGFAVGAGQHTVRVSESGVEVD